MPFLPNIPLATDKLSVSQGDINNNFTILGAIAGGNGNANSASIDTTAVAGRPSGFNWVYFQPNGSNPPAGTAFAAGTNALYTGVGPNPGVNDLFVNLSNGTQVPITGNNSSNPLKTWSYIPSGFIILMGSLSQGAGTLVNGNNVVTFNTWPNWPIPAGFNAVPFTVLLTMKNATNVSTDTVRLIVVSSASITIFGSGIVGGSACYFTVIGH